MSFVESEIAHRLSLNKQLYAKLEEIENDRTTQLNLVADWQEKLSQIENELQTETELVRRETQNISELDKDLTVKTEHVHLLSDQNRQHISILEASELAVKKAKDTNMKFTKEILEMKEIEFKYNQLKSSADQQIAVKQESVEKKREFVESAKQELQKTRVEYTSIEAQLQLEIDAMENALKTFKSKNLQFTEQQKSQEVRISQLETNINNIKVELQFVREENVKLHELSKGQLDQREAFAKTKAELLKAIDREEASISTNKELLASLEKEIQQIQSDRRDQDANLRESSEKAYSLMDAIRAVEVEDKKQEAENNSLDKRLKNVEKVNDNLNTKISIESVGKETAEKRKAECDLEQDKMRRSSKRMEEETVKNQKFAEKKTKELFDIQNSNNQLWSQNAQLSGKLDSVDEEKNHFFVDLTNKTQHLSTMASELDHIRDETKTCLESISGFKETQMKLQSEYDFIHRMDAVENQQIAPIQIVSDENGLLAKLQINDFLVKVQRHTQPIPLLVEKIASLLAQLHGDQSNADQCLVGLAKSNTMVSQLRAANVELIESKHNLASFKLQAIGSYVLNQLDQQQNSNISLVLDGLSMEEKQLTEVFTMIKQFKAEERITHLSMTENLLFDDSLATVIDMIHSFPYLKLMDLKRNGFSAEGIKRVETQVRSLEGVTSVIISRSGSNGGYLMDARSGPQLRMKVDFNDQQALTAVKSSRVPKLLTGIDANIKEADNYLKSTPGNVRRSSKQSVVPVGLGGPGDVALLDKRRPSRN
jgi:chromosome segregation ATPase